MSARSLKSVAVAVSGAAVFLIAGLVIHLRRGVDLGDLTRDIVTTAEVPLSTGFLSQLGIFGWTVAATAAGIAATTLRGRSDSREAAGFLGCFALLSVLLGVDDVFLLHEAVLPWIGIPQIVVLAIYMLLTAGLLVRFRRQIVAAEFPLFVAALLLFGVSVLLDQVHVSWLGFDTSVFIEDGSKFTGIVCWAAYFWKRSASLLQVCAAPGGQSSA
jgi:hypothetical protein